MTKAVFNGTTVAESDDVKVIEGASYFPVADVNLELLAESPTTSHCIWKGKASYFHVDGGDDTALDAAFQYKKPWPLARKLVTDRIGFWRDVRIEP
jgi:uncharacterized protein (DUF427 family)